MFAEVQRRVVWGCLVLCGGWVGGCATDKLAVENFRQIRLRVSTEAEVISLVGPPDSKLQEHWIYQRPDKHLTAIVEFDPQGRVSRTQWIDALEENWEDTDEAKTGGK